METTRRSITRGAAWAAPVIALGGAASASAASGVRPSIDRSFLLTPRQGTCASGTQQLVVSTDDSAYRYRIINATSSTTVTNVTASVLVSVSGLTFTSNAGWGPITQDTTQTYSDGTTSTKYYRYFATLSGAVPTQSGGTITMPKINWVSSCSTSLSSRYYANGRGAATINGTPQTQVGVWRTFN